MIRYRPFRNTDPPALVDIWRSQPPLRRRAQGIDVTALERYVFSKPYFEREGLIVAEEAGRPVGFVHAGFGPVEDGSTLSDQRGAIGMLLANPHASEDVTSELLHLAEQYLLERGAKELYGGEHGRLCPFYLGLYGGCRPAGILEADPVRQVFLDAGYQPHRRLAMLQRSMTGFRPPVDRQQMQIRRSCHIEATIDPPAASWWDACTVGSADRSEFALLRKDRGEVCARALFCEMEVLSHSWGVRACGLCELQILEQEQAGDLAAYLLGESLRQLQGQGVSLIEAQVDDGEDDSVYQRLGFEQADTGEALRKNVEPA